MSRLPVLLIIIAFVFFAPQETIAEDANHLQLEVTVTEQSTGVWSIWIDNWIILSSRFDGWIKYKDKESGKLVETHSHFANHIMMINSEVRKAISDRGCRRGFFRCLPAGTKLEITIPMHPALKAVTEFTETAPTIGSNSNENSLLTELSTATKQSRQHIIAGKFLNRDKTNQKNGKNTVSANTLENEIEAFEDRNRNRRRNTKKRQESFTYQKMRSREAAEQIVREWNGIQRTATKWWKKLPMQQPQDKQRQHAKHDSLKIYKDSLKNVLANLESVRDSLASTVKKLEYYQTEQTKNSVQQANKKGQTRFELLFGRIPTWIWVLISLPILVVIGGSIWENRQYLWHGLFLGKQKIWEGYNYMR